MPVNHYFQSGIPSSAPFTGEQGLLQSLIIESIKIYGFETYYIPRFTVNEDKILNEDVLNKYVGAYPIEMYLENVQGFEGDGDLLTRFGMEIRDQCTLMVAKKRWLESVSEFTQFPTRPGEGDIIYFPLTESYFEIRKVDAKNPFFQLGKLYSWKLQCELMQFSSERFDTGFDEIDSIINSSLDTKIFNLVLEDGGTLLLENETQSSLILEDYDIQEIDPFAQNERFRDEIDILDFSESNPFGNVR